MCVILIRTPPYFLWEITSFFYLHISIFSGSKNFDVYMAVTNVFYSVLYTMEDEGHLNLSNELHFFCCHYAYIPRLLASLDVFRGGWDDHPFKSEQNISPNQLWDMECLVPDPDVSSIRKMPWYLAWIMGMTSSASCPWAGTGILCGNGTQMLFLWVI